MLVKILSFGQIYHIPDLPDLVRLFQSSMPTIVCAALAGQFDCIPCLGRFLIPAFVVVSSPYSYGLVWKTSSSNASSCLANIMFSCSKKTAENFLRLFLQEFFLFKLYDIPQHFEGLINPINNWLVVSNMFYFHPYLGKWSNLSNIFQMGWNHQPVKSAF